MGDDAKPFTLNIPEEDLEDLRRRLRATRWPSKETVSDASQGVPLQRLQDLVQYWATDYDWRRCEAMLNGFGQHTIEIDGLEIYFLHVRSPEPDALPLLMTHGWPGAVLEFAKVIGPLTDPVRYGGKASDAFHLVLPAIPGFGLSGKPEELGWNINRIANAWVELMKRLGYSDYVAQGGDWGAGITTELGVMEPEGLQAIHLNMPTAFVPPGPEGREMDADELAAIQALTEFDRWEAPYSKLQNTRPQTLGYSLADSPVGQAAWIYEKIASWSESGGNPETVFTRDEILDIITLYWLTNSGVTSARIYWESQVDFFTPKHVKMPVGCTIFPGEIVCVPRKWADVAFSNIIHWSEVEKGGHFAALEQPEIFCEELRTCFRQAR